MTRSILSALYFSAVANAHVAAWVKGMYCLGGPDPNVDDPNTKTAVDPLYQLSKEDWWFQHDRGCDQAPPKEGDILSLPANGQFTVELAHNRGQTTLSNNGAGTSDWPDGQEHPDDWAGPGNPPDCIQDDGAMHTHNESTASGSAFAISYVSELQDVTMENLVVFTTLDHTPWKRVATYDVPDLPACPEGGCICAWLWVPNGCGQPNMYMAGYKCNVTDATATHSVAPAQVPTYCRDDPAQCVGGAKQMIAWHQLDGNNIPDDVPSPAYNAWNGYQNGAQNDIFVS